MSIDNLMGQLVGTPYVFWSGRDWADQVDQPPFYVDTSRDIDIGRVRRSGCNCAGFINLILRSQGLGDKIPGLGHPFPGGTVAYYTWLKWEPFDSDKVYPKYTLLLRRYRDFDDQGHLAIVVSDDRPAPLENKLAHCCVDRGICIDNTVNESHQWSESGFYELASVTPLA